jgi:hypothetical protein
VARPQVQTRWKHFKNISVNKNPPLVGWRFGEYRKFSTLLSFSFLTHGEFIELFGIVRAHCTGKLLLFTFLFFGYRGQLCLSAHPSHAKKSFCARAILQNPITKKAVHCHHDLDGFLYYT